MSESKTEIVKRLLRDVFDKQAWLKGRTWGLVSENNNPCHPRNNPYGGSHTTIGIDNELVVVVADRQGGIKVFEFILTEKETKLGGEIKGLLQKGRLDFVS